MIDKKKEMSRRYIGVDDISPVYGESMCDPLTHLKGVSVEINNVRQFFPCHQYSVLVPEECRKGAHDEAWDFVKNICKMSSDDRKNCFGHVFLPPIFDLGYEKAKEMYDAWMKKNTVKEMTVEEVSQALGYKVKIVSKEDQTHYGR